MRIYFAIPPFFSLWTVIGGIFFLISKLRNFYRIVNQFVEIIASVSGQSLFYTNRCGRASVNEYVSVSSSLDMMLFCVHEPVRHAG